MTFPPPPLQTSLKGSKKWLSSGGGGVGGGSGPKTLWDAFFGQNNDFTRGYTNNSTLEVGYANRPKKAQRGGYVAFSPIYGPVWLLSNNLCEVIFTCH